LIVPSLAGYSHEHDFGRTIPPALFFTAHHILASTRTNKDPDDVLDDFYGLDLLILNGKAYSAANYFGTWIGYRHENWVNRDFEDFFNPLVGRALTQRPTLSKIPLVAPTSTTADFNPYEFFIGSIPDNLQTTSTLIDAISTFFKSQSKSSPQLGNILSSISGILLFSYSIEPPTLPTWSGKPYVQDDSPDFTNDSDHVRTHHFLAPRKTFTHSVRFPSDTKELVTNRYLIEDKKFDSSKDPISNISFDIRSHTNPYVLYFQPYDVSPSSLGYTIACGLKIEHGEITGFMIPIEHPEDSLDDNNSQYLQTAIRLNQVRKIFADTDPRSHRVMRRDFLDRTNQAITLMFRTLRRNVLPFFANVNVSNSVGTGPMSIPGMHAETNHPDPDDAATIATGTEGNIGRPDHSIHLWSSYRVVHRHLKPTERDISMLTSLRHIYGLNVTLSRTKNPVLMIPH
jgi:hypothetical protein